MVHWPLMAQQGSNVTPHIQLEVCGRLQTNAFSGRQEGCQMLLRTSRPRSLQAEVYLVRLLHIAAVVLFMLMWRSTVQFSCAHCGLQIK